MNWCMKTGKTKVWSLLLMGALLLTETGHATAAESFAGESVRAEAQDGIFKNRKKKKKDCDCPGNKKNRRKVARERRRNRTAMHLLPVSVASPALLG